MFFLSFLKSLDEVGIGIYRIKFSNEYKVIMCVSIKNGFKHQAIFVVLETKKFGEIERRQCTRTFVEDSQ